MKTFKNIAAQGDIMIIRIATLPPGLERVSSENGNLIITHSETGHHHVVKNRPNVVFYTGNDPMVSYLEVLEATDATETLLEHLRSFDTHAPLKFDSGVYEIRRQREYTPEGWRRVED